MYLGIVGFRAFFSLCLISLLIFQFCGSYPDLASYSTGSSVGDATQLGQVDHISVESVETVGDTGPIVKLRIHETLYSLTLESSETGGVVACFSSGRLTDIVFKNLSATRRLECLLLDQNTKIEDSDIETINQLKSLRLISFCGTSVTQEGLRKLSLPNLEELRLANMSITGRVLEALSHSRKLKRMELRGVSFENDALAPLASIEALEEVDLGGSNVQDADVKFLGRLKHLRVLRLNSTLITGQALEYLSGAYSLRELNLCSTRTDDRGIGHLGKLRNLEMLDLAGTNIGDKAIDELVLCGGLCSLNLAGTKVTDNGVEKLGCFKNLFILDLSCDKGVSDQATFYLSKYPIAELNLRGTLVSDIGLVELAKDGALRQLNVMETQMSPLGISWFTGNRPQIHIRSDYFYRDRLAHPPKGL